MAGFGAATVRRRLARAPLLMRGRGDRLDHDSERVRALGRATRSAIWSWRHWLREQQHLASCARRSSISRQLLPRLCIGFPEPGRRLDGARNA